MAIYLDETTHRNQEATGIPMSMMMLQATIEKYLGGSEALLQIVSKEQSTDRQLILGQLLTPPFTRR